jgi:hypothetical protein
LDQLSSYEGLYNYISNNKFTKEHMNEIIIYFKGFCKSIKQPDPTNLPDTNINEGVNSIMESHYDPELTYLY